MQHTIGIAIVNDLTLSLQYMYITINSLKTSSFQNSWIYFFSSSFEHYKLYFKPQSQMHCRLNMGSEHRNYNNTKSNMTSKLYVVLHVDNDRILIIHFTCDFYEACQMKLQQSVKQDSNIRSYPYRLKYIQQVKFKIVINESFRPRDFCQY